jgi:hypothetical protein
MAPSSDRHLERTIHFQYFVITSGLRSCASETNAGKWLIFNAGTTDRLNPFLLHQMLLLRTPERIIDLNLATPTYGFCMERLRATDKTICA